MSAGLIFEPRSTVGLSHAEVARGLAWARAWRRRTKPHFDAFYGSDQDHHARQTEAARGRDFARRWRAERRHEA